MYEDLYGFSGSDLEEARLALEPILGVHFTPRDSLYLGGSYYLAENNSETFILQRNVDELDDEPAEEEFADIPILLYVEGTTRPAELEKALTASLADVVLLRRYQY
jgi:hypothetical protein